LEGLLEILESKKETIKSNKCMVILISLLFKYLIEVGTIKEEGCIHIRKQLRYNKKVIPDTYVPTEIEVINTIDNLSPNSKILYEIYLFSGLRKIELNYVLSNYNKLTIQQFDGFVKISTNYLRKNKNSYFCYLPDFLFNKFKEYQKQLSICTISCEIKRKKLIPIKYCRKWFYTKCIELGIPESIADFYEGRVASSVGGNHYLSRQMLADKYYGEKLVDFFRNFVKSTDMKNK